MRLRIRFNNNPSNASNTSNPSTTSPKKADYLFDLTLDSVVIRTVQNDKNSQDYLRR